MAKTHIETDDKKYGICKADSEQDMICGSGGGGECSIQDNKKERVKCEFFKRLKWEADRG